MASSLPLPGPPEPNALGSWSLLAVFAALPGANLLLTLDYRVAAVTDTYLAATGLTREQLVGSHLLEFFAGAPGSVEAATMAALRRSLEQVVATGQRQSMPPQHFGLPSSIRPGTQLAYIWQPTNAPVFDAQGQVCGLVHTIVDVTATYRAEQALAASQVRELASRRQAEEAAETHRTDLVRMLTGAPVAAGIFRGADLTIDFANPEMALIWGRPLEQVVGKPVFEALPEVAGQGFEQIFADVLTHGTPYRLQEVPVTIDRAQTGRPTRGYFNISYQPQYDGQGRIAGIATLALEVTEQVLARQHTQALNEELAALNQELQASNEEYLAANAALAVSQRQLRALTQELEARVLARTQQAQVAQAEAETQRQRLATLLAQVPALIASLTGPRHIVALTNTSFQQLYGNRELVGKPCAEALPELVSQTFIALLDQVYQTGETHYGHETLAYIDRTGTGPLEGRYFNFIYQATRDAEGQVTGVLVFATDVTEGVRARQQAETMQAAMLAVAQRQAQQRQDLYQIFEQTPAAIVLLREPDHRIDYFNPAFEALFPPEEWAGPLRGHPLTEVYPRLKVAGLVTLLDQVFQTGEGLIVNEMPLADLQPGSPRFVTFSYQAYREQERIAGVAAFVYDVTEQVLARQQVLALNDELARTNQQLRHTNTDLDTFVYTASHDLKAPIANIEGLLTALRGQLPAPVLADALVAQMLRLMDGAVSRFQQTIGHLTEISQLQQAEAPVALDLAALVDDVRLDLAPLLLATEARLRVDVAACGRVQCAPKTLRSVVYNLLSNALKYRSPHRLPEVELRCQPTAGRVVLTVQDNGLGLSETQQAQLFGMFRRLHTHVEGSGVGLFMVKRLVENAGGTITVQSQPDSGSVFTVSLPA